MANEASTGADGANANRPARDEVAAELRRILSSRCFEQAGRASEFLRYVVEQSLAGNADRLKGYTIAVEVFDKPADFDAQSDPLVRVEAGRLRRRLAEYYADEGAANPVRISLPRGRYAPEFALAGVNRAGRDEREIAANGAQSAASSGSASTAAGGGDARLSPADTRGGAPAAQRAEAPSGVLGLWRRFGVPVAMGAAIVALAAIAIIQARHTHEELTARPELLELPAGPRVLVMPFENLSDDEALDYFADGITEEIMLNLGAFDLFVIPSRTSWYYRDSGLPQGTASVETAASYVLTGTVRKTGEHVRITARLVDARTGGQLWAAAFEKTLSVESLLAIEKEIATEVGKTIAVPYGPIFRSELARANDTPAEHLDTYDCVLKYYNYRRTVDPALHGEAVACFELAVTREPGFADAWAGLALLYLDEHGFGYTPQPSPKPALERALDGARRALDINGDNYLANLAMARARFFRGDLSGFYRSAARVLELEPYNAEAFAIIGVFHALSGHPDLALPLLDKAAALAPEPIGTQQIGYTIVALVQGRSADALQAALRIDAPNWFIAPLLVAVTAAHAGETDVAERAAARLEELYPDFAEHADDELAKWQLDARLRDIIVRGLDKAGLRGR